MEAQREPFLAWPGWEHCRLALLQTALLTLWFILVYVGADWLTAQRTARVPIHLGVELQTPFVPAFTLVYVSVYFLFLVVPFVLRTRRELTRLALAEAITVTIAGICFLLIPAQLVYPPVTDAELGIWADMYRWADRLNLDYNLAPSLHVALSMVCMEMFARRTSNIGRILLRVYGLVIALSTLLIHQHHLLDVATGFLLAYGVSRFTRERSH